jgi:hypothetical protein
VHTQHTGLIGYLLPRHRITVWCLVMVMLLSSAGCSLFKRSRQPTDLHPIPLTPVIWFSPSITTGGVPYRNACGEAASLSLNDVLRDAVPKQLTGVFAGVTAQSQPDETIAADGVVEVGIALRRIDLVIPKQGQGSYPATATVGLEMVFLARDGTLLFSKKREGVGRGTVNTRDQLCEVEGVDALVQQAIDSAAGGLAQEMARVAQIREYAAQRDTWVPMAVRPRPDGAPPAAVVLGVSPAVATEATQHRQETPIEAVQPAQVSFRAIIRDESRDQLLEPAESLTIEIEVKNEGSVEAKDVMVLVEGKAELAALFPSEVLVGTLQPGEIKRISITKRMTTAEEALQGELTLNLRTASAADVVPRPKIFSLGVKRKDREMVLAPDVDQLPKSLAAFKQPKAVIITIGVGSFRDEQVPAVKYATHDAAVMAEYLHAIGNVPRERIRVLLDRQALRRDLEETFERWLRKQVDAQTVVYVFFSGRALVDGVTGAVSLVPHDGTLSASNELYPLRRLQESLYHLPIQRAILMFDVSMDPSPGADLSAMPPFEWEFVSSEERKHVEMWMVGNRNLQEAHAYEQGKHGLFTYHLLRGLQGIADMDRDGTVMAGELCTYARGQVARVAREQFGNKQDPICVPSTGRGAMVRIHPVAKGNNPKLIPMPRQPESSGGSSVPTPNPTHIGP